MAITTYSELKSAIAYDSDTGKLSWKEPKQGRRKDRVGALRPDGYTTVCLNGKQFLAHQIAWMLGHKTDHKPNAIDHINRDKQDNRLDNLRDGSNGVNEMNHNAHKNSPFGLSGVRKACKDGHYQAYMTNHGSFKSFYHGDDFFEACCARKSAENKYWESL
jgi:hypothetical protein